MDRGKRPIRSSLGASNNKIYMDLKDIIRENALPFLPAKSLFRFRGVCRDWKLQISTPFFAHNQSISSRAVLGFFSQTPGGPPKLIPTDPKSCGVPDPTLSFLPVPVDLKDSSNGLVCCQARTGDRAYYVCNPVTKQFKKIPKPTADHGPEPAIVLVFEPSILEFEADYKLICPFPSEDFDDAVEFEIYSAAAGKWKVSGEICFSPRRLVPKSGIQVNGVVYWQTNGTVLAYDVTKDRSRLLQSSGYCGGSGILAAIGGRLCSVYLTQRSILVNCLADVYSNTKEMTSWSRMWMEVYRVPVGGEVTDRKASVVFAGGDVAVIQDDEKMVCYNLKSRESKDLGRGPEINAGTCEDISAIISKFWWSNGKEFSGMKWISLQKLCDRKELGGLGFRDIKAFNLALPAKQGWRLISNPNSLAARVLKAKYFPNSSFWEATRPSSASYTWKSIWDARFILEKGCRWQIGNGMKTKVWKDKWVPRPHSLNRLQRVLILN